MEDFAMRPKKRILAIGFTKSEFERIGSMLDLGFHDIDRFPSAKGALELIDFLPFDLLLARHPLRELPTTELLQTIRHRTRSKTAAIAVVADAPSPQEADGLLAAGANRVLDFDAPPDYIEASLVQLLYVAPRRDLRCLTQIETRGRKERELILAQAQNASMSGLLLATRHKLDQGTLIDFRFELPTGAPIRGRGEVVRHTRPELESVDGMGVRFLSFVGDSQRAYQDYLSKQR
jgi:CheY-like chemotaxis protein